MATSTFYALELQEGVTILEYKLSYFYRVDMIAEFYENKARFYKIMNPRLQYVGYSYAWCDNEENCILLKPFPANELYPHWYSSAQHLIPYEKIHITMDPVEADQFWKENRHADERERSILHGLSSLHEAMRGLERADAILATPGAFLQPMLASETKPSKTQKRISKLIIADALASNATCSITMNPLTLYNAVCVAPCYHVFEREGILKWLQTNTTCPECREPCCL